MENLRKNLYDFQLTADVEITFFLRCRKEWNQRQWRCRVYRAEVPQDEAHRRRRRGILRQMGMGYQ